LKGRGAPFGRQLGFVACSCLEDHHRMSNVEQVFRIAGLATKAKPSVGFGGYWQRHTQAV
jgi:hypothetical protein